MNREIEQALLEIENLIVLHKEDVRKLSCEILINLKESYPDQVDEIEKQFWAIYERHNVDFFSEIRINGNDIMKYIEQL